jgi:hypothetical protein
MLVIEFLGFMLLLLSFLSFFFHIRYPKNEKIKNYIAVGMIIIIFLLGFIISLEIQERKWNECIDKYGYKYCNNASYD